jgi:hypothetical protein
VRRITQECDPPDAPARQRWPIGDIILENNRRIGRRDNLWDRGTPIAKECEEASVRSFSAGQRVNTADLQAIGRERAGLIQAQHVDVAERLDRVGLLYKRAEANDPHRAQRVSYRDRQEQAIRYQASHNRGELDALGQLELPEQRVDG